MKHRVFLLILVAVACTSQNRGPLVRYKSKVIELGTITFKNEFLGSIIIENFGDEPLVLLGATATKINKNTLCFIIALNNLD